SVDLEDIIHDAALDSGSGKWSAVDLVIDLAPSHRRVWADRGAVRQIFANLLSNAIRYTPPGGAVTVRTLKASRRSAEPEKHDAVEGWTTIEVADTGAGIARPHLSRIFERFYRADPARS